MTQMLRKSDSNTPVSTPSKYIDCENDCLILADKTLSTKESASAKKFQADPIDTWDFVETDFFGSYSFGLDCVVKLLYTEAGTKLNCSITRQKVNDGRSDVF